MAELLNEKIQKQLRDIFAGLSEPVTLAFFTQGPGGMPVIECQTCGDARQLLEEVSALSDKITLEIYDLLKDEAVAKQYQVDKIPALVILGGAEKKDYGMRISGIPSGYEFGSLIEDIMLASKGKPELRPATLEALGRLTKPVHIQVYVTPTWPYCPRAVLLAHQMAMASEWVTAEMVEAMEFPHLANRYQVYGVPRTVINEVIHIEGAVPEEMLIDELMVVMDDQQMEERKKEWDNGE